MIRELLACLRKSRRDNDQLRQCVDPLLRRPYGPSAERFDPHHPFLFMLLQSRTRALLTSGSFSGRREENPHRLIARANPKFEEGLDRAPIETRKVARVRGEQGYELTQLIIS
jgi:hypothetical protein